MTFTGTLWPYQEEAKDKMVDRGQMLLGVVMGGGKTVIALAAVEELHDQGEVDRCLLVVPASLKFQWLREIAKFTDAKATVIDGTPSQRAKAWRMSVGSRYVIVNPETLVNDQKLMGKYEAMVIDECFTAGTLVDALGGPLPIEEIRPGMWVRNAAGLGQVEAVTISKASSLVRVTLEDGTFMVATPNHPVLTRNGFSTMVKLSHDDELITAREAMRLVRGGLDQEGAESKVLQHVLLSEMADQPTLVAGSSRVRFGEKEGFGSPHGGAKGGYHYCRGADNSGQERQSSVDGSVYGGYEESTQRERSPSPYTGRERKRPDRTSAPIVGSSGAIMDFGVCSAYGHKAERWTPVALQDRLGAPEITGSSGSGWAQPSYGGRAGTRCAERQVSSGSRVVSVEVLESGSDEFSRYGSTVYNLQVSNHPSYSVNGYLVHNCTMIKNRTSKRSRLLKRIGKTIHYRFALTGQPIENRPEELFSLMEYVDKDVLGTFTLFDSTFIRRDHWGRPVKYVNLPVLYDAMQDCMVRKTREDIADQLPKIIHTVVPVPFDARGAATYRLIANDLLGQLSAVIGKGGFNLWAHYNGGEDNEAQGQIMARLTVLRMLCDNPALVSGSAQDYLDPRTTAGSAYASQIVAEGWMDGVQKAPKLEAVLEYIEEVLSEDHNNKVVLFSFFKKNLRMIQEATSKITDSVLFMGGMSAAERDTAKQKFATDPKCRLFLSSDAGGYGVDLPMANYLCSYDLPWSSGKLEQREARIIRLSSTFDHVNIVSFVMQGSIEERQYEMLVHKRNINEAFVDGKHQDVDGSMSIDVSTLTEFLKDSSV